MCVCAERIAYRWERMRCASSFGSFSFHKHGRARALCLKEVCTRAHRHLHAPPACQPNERVCAKWNFHRWQALGAKNSAQKILLNRTQTPHTCAHRYRLSNADKIGVRDMCDDDENGHRATMSKPLRRFTPPTHRNPHT